MFFLRDLDGWVMSSKVDFWKFPLKGYPTQYFSYSWESMHLHWILDFHPNV